MKSTPDWFNQFLGVPVEFWLVKIMKLFDKISKINL
jgi:hypothetical protein